MGTEGVVCTKIFLPSANMNMKSLSIDHNMGPTTGPTKTIESFIKFKYFSSGIVKNQLNPIIPSVKIQSSNFSFTFRPKNLNEKVRRLIRDLTVIELN